MPLMPATTNPWLDRMLKREPSRFESGIVDRLSNGFASTTNGLDWFGYLSTITTEALDFSCAHILERKGLDVASNSRANLVCLYELAFLGGPKGDLQQARSWAIATAGCRFAIVSAPPSEAKLQF